MSHTHTPDCGQVPYDVEDGLAELAILRRTTTDQHIVSQKVLAERLARAVAESFTDDERELAGKALVVLCAHLTTFVEAGVHPAAMVNVTAFAGQRLVVDARAAADGISRTAWLAGTERTEAP